MERNPYNDTSSGTGIIAWFARNHVLAFRERFFHGCGRFALFRDGLRYADEPVAENRMP